MLLLPYSNTLLPHTNCCIAATAAAFTQHAAASFML
jgi:hypothetical protein